MEKKEGKSIMNINWGIPLSAHIGTVIFSKLSISNLPGCRLVCKSWNTLILDYASTPKLVPNAFIYALYNLVPTTILVPYSNLNLRCLDIDTLSSHASFQFPDDHINHFAIFHYCNGLLLVAIKSHAGDRYDAIFNPMTGEFFKLPLPDKNRASTPYGFGFNSRTKQYKLFKVPGSVPTSKPTNIMKIFTFGKSGTDHKFNQWRTVHLPFTVTLWSQGAYFDGIIYWIGREKENELVVYTLDVGTEEIKLVAVMEVGPYFKRAILKPINGTLYAIIFRHNPCPAQIQLWRMQESNSWIRDFVVVEKYFSLSFHLVKALDDGGLLFLANNDLFCLDKFGGTSKIKTFTTHYTQDLLYACPIEALHFGSLPNILAGEP